MSVPPRDLPRVAWRRILRELRTRTAPRTPRAIEVGASIQEIAEQLRARQLPRFFGLFPEQAALIGHFFPDAWQLTIEQADKIVAHRFDLLGSGEKELGTPIDWHVDFKNNHHWPVEHHTRLKLTAPDGGFDVKVPWELSCFHHAVRLGQAYLYTLDEKYAQEIVGQITHWIGANPYEFGVNWAGPMDVAIRVVNWIWAYYLIVELQALDTKFLALWLASLRQHGDYLLKHLEDGWPRTNHLIANLTGLAFLGILFPEFPDAARWRAVGVGRLWDELERQVYPDGVDYEASIPYHGLVTEMALNVAGLCIVNNVDIPDEALARLHSMLDVIMAYTRPDGLAPQVGDADDGRLLPLSVYADPVSVAADHRHLLALGSIVLERELSEWAGFIEPTRRGWSIAAASEWQDAFWCFASDAAARFTDVITQTTGRPEDDAPDEWVTVRPGVRVRARALARHPVSLNDVTGSRGFEASGLYVLRNRDFHMTVDAGSVGQDGAGGHAHNDTLSLTLAAYGRTFLVDPGSYAYSDDPAARIQFRSTAYHNTLQVSGEEINRMPDDLFRLANDARVTVHHWISTPNFDLFDASHTGYARLEPGVIYRRQVWFDKLAGLWVLHDQLRLAAEDGHQPAGQALAQPANLNGDEDKDAEQQAEAAKLVVSVWFHFAPLLVRLDQPNNALRTEAAEGPNIAILPLGDFPLRADLSADWYSPRYGVRKKAPVARFTGRAKLPLDLVLLLYPHQAKIDFDAVRSAGRAALLNMQQTLTPSLKPGARKAADEKRP